MEITTSLAGQGGAVFRRDGKPITTSKMVANLFGKQHKNVLRDIRNLIEMDPDLALSFEPEMMATPTGKGGTRMVPCYTINQRGAALLVMGFTGPEALAWKKKFLDAFDHLAERERDTHREVLSSFRRNPTHILKHRRK
ncbi:Rha family transcriptional regulator [Paracoccus sp. (in: a-proteobacteria)]|uniref:Rha family transcriptional regulator n=1 Tax=Paracoccus sp. TaxID=267 RepID=UPI00272C622A|nr:Rha family transcriptional regulator [Paracoccus sp. (in: a-proteobacteria)]